MRRSGTFPICFSSSQKHLAENLSKQTSSYGPSPLQWAGLFQTKDFHWKKFLLKAGENPAGFPTVVVPSTPLLICGWIMPREMCYSKTKRCIPRYIPDIIKNGARLEDRIPDFSSSNRGILKQISQPRARPSPALRC